MIDIVATFITFFAVVDPIGTVPVFIAVTNRFDEKARRRIALIATLAAAGILLFFVVAGELILAAMSIPLSAFQIAGGIVLFLFALTMIFGESKPDEELRLAVDHKETAIFPLAVPSIASPGAMLAAVLLTENARYSIAEQAQTYAVLIAVLLVAYVLMLLAGPINRLIGSSGASVVSRVMGLILSSVAMANLLAGLRSYFSLG
ncbi:MAG: MarC family protein [Gammaproteobacteria bacterium]|nr:MarC family protein [Gammaproteobacteria bacterium]